MIKIFIIIFMQKSLCLLVEVIKEKKLVVFFVEIFMNLCLHVFGFYVYLHFKSKWNTV